ncbi:CBN-CLC-2 protein [Caenorhabditis brenneri]|uniref:CBN-CLC-2 protein n=1 Tax=Caenorhabditis brenneri TaxID=135651 RepID=G0NKZ6_CAEBE|nr:CBN-CLC-2 protein [Caenorhabditis brenneri]
MGRAVSYAILVLTIIAFFLTAVALCTPAWQVVYAREIRQWVQSGLWLSCQTRPNGMYSCTYTFSHDDFNTYFSDEVSGFRTPSFYPWQRTLFHIYLISQAFAMLSMISFCVSVSHRDSKLPHILRAVFLLLAAVIAFGCLIAFAKHRGYSWYIALAGAFVYLVAIILSVVNVLMQARNGNSTMSRQNINSSLQSDFFEYQYHPNRSMESFEDRFAMRTLPPVPRQEKKTTVF